LLAAAMMLVAGACTTQSLDEEVQAGSAADATTSSVVNEPATTTELPPPSSTPSDAASDDDSSPPAVSTDGDCPLDSLSSIMDDAFGADPQQADVGELADVFDQLEQAVPADLVPDLRMLEDAIVPLVEQLQGLEGQDPSTMSTALLGQMEAAFAALDTPQIRAASDRVEAYFRTVCPDYPFDSDEGFEPIGEAVPG
jgi:hypothetical protein